jgi:hypothetical protein
MSKKIDLTKKLSEFDLKYLVDRNRWSDLREYAEIHDLPEPALPSVRDLRRQVPRSQLRNTDSFADIAKALKVSTSNEADDGDETPPGSAQPEDRTVFYGKLTVPQLKEEMDSRKAKYEAEEDADGVALMTYAKDEIKADLIARLVADDEDEADDTGDGDDAQS